MPQVVVTSYSNGTPPPSTDPVAMALYQSAENRKISRSIQSIVAVVQHQGTTLASGAFGATGVKAGTYTNPTVTVAQDGRVTQILSGDSPFPKGGQSGQFLASDGNGGLSWRWAASGSGGSSSGSAGSASSSPSRSVTGSADIGVVTSGSSYTLSLLPTGVAAGTYSRANLTVDANGRITAVSSGPDLQPAVSTLQTEVAALQTALTTPPIYATQLWRSPDDTVWTVTMSNAGTFVTTLTTHPDAVTAQDGTTMISTEDGSDYISY